MPLMPKRTKHRKMQKGRMRGKATRGNRVTDGMEALQGQSQRRILIRYAHLPLTICRMR